MAPEKHITVLLVDDEEKFLDSISERIRLKGFAALTATSGEAALATARNNHVDMAIVDQRMPGMDGLTTITKLKEIAPAMRTVLLTGFGNEKLKEAAEALDSDYFEKDNMSDFWGFIRQFGDSNEMIIINPRSGGAGRKSGERRGQSAGRSGTAADGEDSGRVSYSYSQRASMAGLIGETRAFQQIKNDIRRVAPLNCSVLIVGEGGTGRKLVAETIHSLSPRFAGPFIPVNCATFDEELLFRELFGRKAGALLESGGRLREGVFEIAAGGTVLLEEVGGAPAGIQNELLRLLSGEMAEDVRVLAATGLPLAERIAAGEFSESLYRRLKTVTIQIPPLRERRADIPLLAHYFLDRYRKELDKNVKEISDAAMRLFQGYPFPGNVAELENAIKHAVIMSEGGRISRAHLPRQLVAEEASEPPADTQGLVTLAELEDQYIEKVVRATRGNKSEAARILGINRASLWRKLKKRRADMENSQPIKLLIVDDDEKFLNTIAERLGLKDFDVTTAVNGEQALKSAQGGTFDVAIVDLNMPGMDGKELLKILKENHAFLEVIILTGYASIDSAVECTKLGAFGYLEKPYDFENLLEMLKSAYESRLRKKFERDAKRTEEIETLSVGSSPLGILRSLKRLDDDLK